MPRRKRNYNKKGRGIIENIKNRYNTINDYLKAKKYAHNLITDDINNSNNVRAIWQAFGINKYLQKWFLGKPLQYLAKMGYGKNKK